MTSEKAREVLIKNRMIGSFELADAIDFAIKALDQDPCDAVSRKELLKIYEDRFLELQKIKHLKDNKGAEDRQMGVNYCINVLKEMPPVTPAEIDILKKDLKGRQKKIEKLISSDVRHACEAEHFKDLYLIECKKNCALFLRYKDVSRELALLKNSKEESEG